MAECCLLTLSLTIIEDFHARRGCTGNSTLQTLHSKGRFLELKLFITYFSLFKISAEKKLRFHSQKLSIFSFLLRTLQTRVSRHMGCCINDIKYCRSWIFLHIICLPYSTYLQKCWLMRFNALYE